MSIIQETRVKMIYYYYDNKEKIIQYRQGGWEISVLPLTTIDDEMRKRIGDLGSGKYEYGDIVGVTIEVVDWKSQYRLHKGLFFDLSKIQYFEYIPPRKIIMSTIREQKIRLYPSNRFTGGFMEKFDGVRTPVFEGEIFSNVLNVLYLHHLTPNTKKSETTLAYVDKMGEYREIINSTRKYSVYLPDPKIYPAVTNFIGGSLAVFQKVRIEGVDICTLKTAEMLQAYIYGDDGMQPMMENYKEVEWDESYVGIFIGEDWES